MNHNDDLKENTKDVKQALDVSNAIEPISSICTMTVTITAHEQYGKLYVDWYAPLPYAVSSNEGIVVDAGNERVASTMVGKNTGTFETGLDYGSGYKISYVAVNVATNQHSLYCTITIP